jgi:protein-S-isoprenylcysteine O-methyltransferase Ste14
MMLIAIVPAVLIRIPFTRVELDFPKSGDYGLTIPVLLFAISALIAVQLPGPSRKNTISWIIVGVILAATSLAVLASYPNRITWGTRVISWHADMDMFLAVPVIAFGFLVAGLNRIRLAVFAVVVQCLVTALILSRQEWGDWVAPYLVSVSVVVYLLWRMRTLPRPFPRTPSCRTE